MRLRRLTNAEDLGAAVLGELKCKHISLWALLAQTALRLFLLAFAQASSTPEGSHKRLGRHLDPADHLHSFLALFCFSSSLRFRVMSPP